MTKTVTPSDAAATIFEIGIMRRLHQGPLRYDGVTAFQRQILTLIHERGWVTLNAASRWDLTPAGRAKLEKPHAPARR